MIIEALLAIALILGVLNSVLVLHAWKTTEEKVDRLEKAQEGLTGWDGQFPIHDYERSASIKDKHDLKYALEQVRHELHLVKKQISQPVILTPAEKVETYRGRDT